VTQVISCAAQRHIERMDRWISSEWVLTETHRKAKYDGTTDMLGPARFLDLLAISR